MPEVQAHGKRYRQKRVRPASVGALVPGRQRKAPPKRGPEFGAGSCMTRRGPTLAQWLVNGCLILVVQGGEVAPQISATLQPAHQHLAGKQKIGLQGGLVVEQPTF
jgi:hypothetical protein